MYPRLNQNRFFIKEHTGIFKAANNYDIFDPDSQELLMICREEKLGFFTKLFRFSSYKTMTPFHVEIKTPDGEPILSVKRGFTFIRSVVQVFDGQENLIGSFKENLATFVGKFDVLDPSGNPLCTLSGKITSWDFRFKKDEHELAVVSKKWGNVAKELFTSADNYMLTIHENVPKDNPIRLLILAAVICVDMVFRE